MNPPVRENRRQLLEPRPLQRLRRRQIVDALHIEQCGKFLSLTADLCIPDNNVTCFQIHPADLERRNIDIVAARQEIVTADKAEALLHNFQDALLCLAAVQLFDLLPAELLRRPVIALRRTACIAHAAGRNVLTALHACALPLLRRTLSTALSLQKALALMRILICALICALICVLICIRISISAVHPGTSVPPRFPAVSRIVAVILRAAFPAVPRIFTVFASLTVLSAVACIFTAAAVPVILTLRSAALPALSSIAAGSQRRSGIPDCRTFTPRKLVRSWSSCFVTPFRPLRGHGSSSLRGRCITHVSSCSRRLLQRSFCGFRYSSLLLLPLCRLPHGFGLFLHRLLPLFGLRHSLGLLLHRLLPLFGLRHSLGLLLHRHLPFCGLRYSIGLLPSCRLRYSLDPLLRRFLCPAALACQQQIQKLLFLLCSDPLHSFFFCDCSQFSQRHFLILVFHA